MKYTNTRRTGFSREGACGFKAYVRQELSPPG
jgi:hypothetical protein